MKTLAVPCAISLLCRICSTETSSSFPLLRLRYSPPSLLHLRPLSSTMASAAQSSSQAPSPGDINSESNVFQLIQSHQEKAARLPPVEEIRTLLDTRTRAMLSASSQKLQGYPSGSMVDFACDADGSPILAVSSLAVHTKEAFKAQSQAGIAVKKIRPQLSSSVSRTRQLLKLLRGLRSIRGSSMDPSGGANRREKKVAAN